MMRLLGSKFSFRPQKFSWFWTSPQRKQKKKASFRNPVETEILTLCSKFVRVP